MHSELTRRHITVTTDGYAVNPIVGGKIEIEHAQKIFDDIKVLNTNMYRTITYVNLKVASNYDAAISYIQGLMNESKQSF